MITYEEFLKENNINKILSINFTSERSILDDAVIPDSPNKYIDIARKAKELVYVKVPPVQSSQYYKDLKIFIENCSNNIKIIHSVMGEVEKGDFLQGEEIIEKIIQEINPQWSKKQMLAYVHYKIGEIVSYIPDFNYIQNYINLPIVNNSRNIWKSIVDKKSVCNGITEIQRNILSRLGIKTEELSSGTHSYMLTQTEEGNIITDATWDLKNTLYGARPMYFGVTYEELLEQEKGISNAHKLKNPPENVIKIPEEELREIYYSIGLTSEDRKFFLPILEKVNNINNQEFNSTEEKIDMFLTMFIQNFSREATHLSETRSMLEVCINDLGIKSQDIKTKFVYSKDDEDCEKPYLITHINNETTKDKIIFLNIDEMKFDKIDIREFDKSYKVHDLDTSNAFWKQYLPSKEIKEKKLDSQKEIE